MTGDTYSPIGEKASLPSRELHSYVTGGEEVTTEMTTVIRRDRTGRRLPYARPCKYCGGDYRATAEPDSTNLQAGYHWSCYRELSKQPITLPASGFSWKGFQRLVRTVLQGGR